MKKALVIRYGAFGDMVWLTPLLRRIKQDGYHITLNCSETGYEVVKHNPNVNKFLVHVRDSVPNDKLDEYWAELGKGYDRVFNVSGIVEKNLLRIEGTPEFNDDHHKRHRDCNRNYVEYTLEHFGYGGADPTMELHFTPAEISWAREYRKKYKGKFLVLWSLSGSSFHKAYPYTEYVAQALVKKPDVMVITVGDSFCKILEWQAPNTKHYSAIWSIRRAMLMTKFADCVVGTETGILNAAGCYDTPKVVLLSHSSVENLSKHWPNTVSISYNQQCQPCHRLIYSLAPCILQPEISCPVCMAKIPSRVVYGAIEEIYGRWRDGVHRVSGSEEIILGGRRDVLDAREQTCAVRPQHADAYESIIRSVARGG